VFRSFEESHKPKTSIAVALVLANAGSIGCRCHFQKSRLAHAPLNARIAARCVLRLTTFLTTGAAVAEFHVGTGAYVVIVTTTVGSSATAIVVIVTSIGIITSIVHVVIAAIWVIPSVRIIPAIGVVTTVVHIVVATIGIVTAIWIVTSRTAGTHATVARAHVVSCTSRNALRFQEAQCIRTVGLFDVSLFAGASLQAVHRTHRRFALTCFRAC